MNLVFKKTEFSQLVSYKPKMLALFVFAALFAGCASFRTSQSDESPAGIVFIFSKGNVKNRKKNETRMTVYENGRVDCEFLRSDKEQMNRSKKPQCCQLSQKKMLNLKKLAQTEEFLDSKGAQAFPIDSKDSEEFASIIYFKDEESKTIHFDSVNDPKEEIATQTNSSTRLILKQLSEIDAQISRE